MPYATSTPQDAPKPPPAPPTPGLPSIADWDADIERREIGRLNENVAKGSQISPDLARRVVNLEGLTGLPAEAIAPRLDKLEQEVRRRDFSGADFLRRSPTVAEYVQESEFYAASLISKDEILRLSNLEQLLRRPRDQWPKSQQYMKAEAKRYAETKWADYDAAIKRSGNVTSIPKDVFTQGVYEARLQDLRDDESYISKDAPSGIWESLDRASETIGRRAKENPAFLVPFLSGAVDLVKTAELYSAAKAVENGTATDDQRDQLIRFGRLADAANRRGTDAWNVAAGAITELPAFAMEFALTSGAYSGVKGAIMKGGTEVAEGLLKRAARKAIGTFAGAAVHSLAAMPIRTAKNTLERMTPKGAVEDEGGRVVFKVKPGTGEEFRTALPKGLLDSFIEVLSERAGAALKPVDNFLFGWWVGKHPGKTFQAFQKMIRQGGIHGVLGEMGEEEVGKLLRAWTAIGPEYQFPTGAELAGQALAFSVFPLAGGAINRAFPSDTEATPEFFRTVQGQVSKLELMGKDPAKIEYLIDKSVRESNPENANVFIPVSEFVEHYQEAKDLDGDVIGPKRVAMTLGVTEKEFESAVETGAPLKVSLGRYMVTIGQSKDAGAFEDLITSSPTEMNGRELKQAMKEQAENAKNAPTGASQEAPSGEAGATQQPSEEDRTARDMSEIGKIVSEQLRSAGFAREADSYTKFIQSRYQARAERRGLGESPLELFRKVPISIERSEEGQRRESGVNTPPVTSVPSPSVTSTSEGGAGGVPGQPIQIPPMEGERTLEQPAYHGSPHKFEKFDLGKVGTGEGQQVFGWGLYFANKKAVAESYRGGLSARENSIYRAKLGGREIGNPWSMSKEFLVAKALRMIADKPREEWPGLFDAALKEVLDKEQAHLDEFKEFGRQSGQDDVDAARKVKASDIEWPQDKGKGRLYHVEIPPDDVFIDLDKHIDDQSETVKRIIRENKLEELVDIPDVGVDPIDLDETDILYTEENKYGETRYVVEDQERGDRRTMNEKNFQKWWKKFYQTGKALYTALQNQETERIDAGSVDTRGPEGASRYLASLGIAGLKYLDQSSRGLKPEEEKSHNYVVFDDRLVDIREFEQPTPAPAGEPPRGKIRIGRHDVKIKLLTGADRSTVIHEFSHLWLDELIEDATLAGAPPALAHDLDAMLSWMGVKARSTDGRDAIIKALDDTAEEKFARGAEAWIMEGKAPSAELRPAFYRFMKWLGRIYQDIKAYFSDIQLTDEVREVFDRLVATDRQIEEAIEEQKAGPKFQDAKLLGASDEWALEYAQATEEWKAAAAARLLAKTMEQVRQQDEAWYKKEFEEKRKEAEAEVNARREYIALSILENGVMPDGTPVPEALGGLKLNRAQIKDRYGADILKAIPKKFLVAEGGADADYAAETINIALPEGVKGFDSGDELLHTILNTQDREALINVVAKLNMKADDIEPLTEDQVREEAQKVLHNSDQAKLMRMELNHVASEEFATFKKLARRVGGKVPNQKMLRAMAEERVAEQRIREVISADVGGARPIHRTIGAYVGIYQKAEQRANLDANEAILKEDWEAFFDARRRALLNHELYLAAAEARDDIGAGLKKLRKLQKTSSIEKLGKMDPEALEQFEALMDRFNLRPASAPALARKSMALSEWYQKQLSLGFEPQVDQEFMDETRRTDYRDLTVEEFRDLVRSVDSILHGARRNHERLKAGKLIAHEDAVKLLTEAAEKNLPQVREQLDKGLRTWLDRFKDKLVDFDTSLIPMETMIEKLDGGAVGPWHDLLWNPSSEAQAAFLDLQDRYGKKIGKLIDDYQKANAARMTDRFKVELPGLPSGQHVISRHGLMSLAFNVLNDSNFDKLVRGFGWEGKEGEIMRALGLLDRRDLELVQSIADVVNDLWPEIQQLHLRVTGVPLEKIEGRPVTITLEGGETVTLKGGYFPIKYDPTLSEAGKLQESMPLAGLVEEGYAIATVPANHRKKRTGFAAPLLLDYASILKGHLTAVMKDLTYREFLIDANALLKDPEVRKVLQQRLGTGYEKMFMGSKDKPGWLRRVANEYITSPSAGLDPWGQAAEWARYNVTIVGLGFKAASLLAQQAGVVNAVEYISDNYGTKFFAHAYADFWKHLPTNLNPDNPDGMLAIAIAKSGEMRHRMNTMDREIADLNQKLKRDKIGSLREAVARASMYGIGLSERLVSIPTWFAAYRGAIAKAAAEGTEITDEQAVHAADAAVRRSQGAGSAKDLSDFQSRRGVQRLFGMFLTPFMAQYGRARAIGGKARIKGWRYTPEALVRLALVTAVPKIMSEILAGRGPGGDDKKKVSLAKWAALKTLLAPADLVPFAREAVFPIEQYLLHGKAADTKYSPVFQAVDKFARTMKGAGEAIFTDKEWTDELGWDVFESSGYIFGLPTGQATITGEFLTDLLTGEERPDTALGALHDLVFRRTAAERKGK